MTSANLDVFAAVPARETVESKLFDEILEKCRDLVSARLDDAVSDMLDNADEVLSVAISDTEGREEWRLYEEARQFVAAEREAIAHRFRKVYQSDFRRRSDRARKIGRPANGAEYSLDELELVGEDDLDETLKFNDMANRVRAYCDDELRALDQRVGVLLGDGNLQTQDNPFSPQVICDGFKNACRELDADVKVRRVLLRLFDDHVLDDIRSVYKAVNALLIRNCILPQIRYSVPRAPDERAPAPPEAVASSPVASLPPGAAQDLFAVLQSLVASKLVPLTSNAAGGSDGPGGAIGPGNGVVVLQGAELLGALTRIQKGDLGDLAAHGAQYANAAVGAAAVNVLHELKTSSLGAGMGQLDRMTLDIIAMLFDELFDDPKVPNGVKGLIGRLQIPVLKVALADKSFFSTKTHPARRLLDAVGDVALRLPADFSDASPLFARLESMLQSLVEGFHESLDIFVSTCEQLHMLMAEEDRRIEQESQAAAKRAEEKEKLALARSVAEMEVQSRLHGHEMPQAVPEFLAKEWIKLLMLLYVRQGAESAGWKDALEVIDQLVWSVEPKSTAEERRKLVALVPSLIKRLTAGLRAASVDDEVRAKFFAELMKCHTQAIGAAQPNSTPAATAAPTPAGGARLAVTALSSGAGTAGSSSPGVAEYAAPITLQNPFGEGEVQVDRLNLDFTAEAAAGARAKREASIRRALDHLEVGSWVEFRDPENESLRRPGRLIFVSPRKSRYVFAIDRAGKEMIECTRADIGHRLRVGDAVKLDGKPDESLFDRIMGTLLSKLRMPGRQAFAGH